MSDITRALELARAVVDFDPEEAARLCDENNEPPTCIECNGEYRFDDDQHDPTPMDHGCAHLAVHQLSSALLALAAANARMEKLLVLVCVDENSKVYREDAPWLFGPEDGRAMYAHDAIARALDAQRKGDS